MITISRASTLLEITLVLMPLVLMACGAHPPKDYYREFALMERLGEEIRRERGREIGSKGPTDELIEPLTLPFEASRTPIISLILRIPQTKEVGKVAFDPDLLKRFLIEKQEIEVSRVEAVNGRAKGGKNVIRVSFIPRSLTDDELLSEYLIICAAVKGFDGENNSVDVVVGLIEDENTLLPYIALQSNMEDYQELEGGKIEYREWASRVEVKSLRER
jgi:hypothetical protein